MLIKEMDFEKNVQHEYYYYYYYYY